MLRSLVALPVAGPLGVAALLMALSRRLGPRGVDAVALATSIATAVLCFALALEAADRPIVYWMGGWVPRGTLAIGIDFYVDVSAACLAGLTATLTSAALTFKWGAIPEPRALFTVLLMVFLAGMDGFALTGDLFDLFVFFELMGVAAYALTGFKIEETGPLQGALGFAVTNTVGAIFVLLGIGLLYGRTGTLNMAQIGQALAGAPPDRLIVTSFVLLTVGFLVKGAIAPFHLWLPDAHAVAPTPVSVLFSGVMVELGLYAVARLWWATFAAAFAGHEGAIRDVLLCVGMGGALLGGVMCFAQSHLKRLLAFSTVSHAGMLLCAFALLDQRALAGAGVYVAAHGLVKGALFMGAGIVLHRLGSVDERELHGRGRELWGAAGVWAVGGLALAGLPVFGTAIGKALMEEGAEHARAVPVVLVAASALTGGAVLRVAARVFLGWGRAAGAETEEACAEDEGPETEGSHERTPATMIGPPAAMLGGALALGLIPGLPAAAMRAAGYFGGNGCYESLTYGRTCTVTAPEAHVALAAGFVAAAGAVLLALAALFGHRLPGGPWLARPARPVLRALRAMHSGRMGDYVLWLLAGAAALGGALAALV